MFLLLPLPILAIEAYSGDNVLLSADQVIDGNYYAAGQNVEIYGKVNGDVFVAGNKIVINSEEINGSIFVAGSVIDIRGVVTGSVRTVGENVSINGKVNGNVFSVGTTVFVDTDAEVGGHLTFWGQRATIRGNIDGQVEGGMESLALSGQVGKDVDVTLCETCEQPTLEVSETAVIAGTLGYSAFKEAEIAEGATIGEVEFNQASPKVKDKQPLWSFGKLKGWLFNLFTILVTGMILLYLWPKFFDRAYHEVRKKPIKTFFKGFLILIVTPIACIIAMVTIIGIPVGIIALVLWGIMLYLAKVISAWLVGKFVKDWFLKDKRMPALAILVIGTLVYIIIGTIPFVGFLMVLVTFLLSWGTLLKLMPKEK